MLLDFWTPVVVSRCDIFRPRTDTSGTEIEDCRTIAHGGEVHISRLWRAQHFAARVWLRLMWLFVSFCLGILLLIPPLRTVWGVTPLVLVMSGMAGTLAVASAFLGAWQYFIASRSLEYARQVEQGRRPEIPPDDFEGLPMSGTFYVILTISMIMCGVLSYAGYR